jgi:excisionase family DNA binding protein
MTEKPELSTKEAAALAAVDASYIRHLLIDGKLKGRKVDNWWWLVSRASLDKWMSERKPRKGR